MLSVIIPAYKEPYLQKTINSLLENAQGKIEVIVILDGYTPPEPLKPDSRVKIISFSQNRGMRAAINAGIAKARGKFIMKCDAHCIFGPGYDKIMAKNCAENWLLIPRRYSLLDGINWQRNDRRPVRDYHYLTFPVKTRGYGIVLSSQDWLKRGSERQNPKYDIDDTMTFQGSCWFVSKKYFMKRVGFLDDRLETYTPFGGEQLEIGLKYWLGGGANKVIKKTWYAHLSKQPRHYHTGLFTRGYKANSNTARSRTWAAKHWLSNEEPGMVHPFSWLVEKFWPVPSWPEDRNLWVFPEMKSVETVGWQNNTKIQKLNLPPETGDTPLCKLAFKYGSDKRIHRGKHSYTQYYYKLLKGIRNKVKKVLEIGIGEKAASLRMWQDFFPNAKIYGADYRESFLINASRIESILCDQRRGNHLKNLIEKTGPDIDLVIDDGSHRPRDQVFTCLTLMPLLKKDAIYVIEDVDDHSITERLTQYDVRVGNTLVVVRHKT